MGKQSQAEQEAKATIIVDNLLSGRNAQESLRAAGYSESVCIHKQGEIISRDIVQNKLIKALENAGINADKLAKVAAEGLDALVFTYTKGGKYSDPDYRTRLAYLLACVKLAGLEPAKHVTGGTYEERLAALAQGDPQAIDIEEIS